MNLPEPLQHAIDEELSKVKASQLAALTQELSQRYRAERLSSFMSSEGHRLAYLAFRFPATYAAIVRVLSELRRFPDVEISSLLDVGSGPGTATFAAHELFDTLKQATLLEKDRDLIELGKRLAKNSSLPFSLEWKMEDLAKLSSVEKKDLVVLSYSIGEVQENHWDKLLNQLWKAANKVLVVIEPGTPVGFSRIRKIREMIIAWGGFITAPCPHQNACPMKEGDWCHFSQRLERSSLHRKIKGGELGYEDEKFSYVIFSKEPCLPSRDRILRHPIKNPGHVSLTLCAKEGLQKRVVSKKEKELYRLARKAEWGEEWEEISP